VLLPSLGREKTNDSTGMTPSTAVANWANDLLKLPSSERIFGRRFLLDTDGYKKYASLDNKSKWAVFLTRLLYNFC
jgi:hypothetical protein